MDNRAFWSVIESAHEIVFWESKLAGDRQAEIARRSGQLAEWVEGSLVGDVYAVDIEPAVRDGVAALAGVSIESVFATAAVAAMTSSRVADEFARVARATRVAAPPDGEPAEEPAAVPAAEPVVDASIAEFASACENFAALRRHVVDGGPYPASTWWGAPGARAVARAALGELADPPPGWAPADPPAEGALMVAGGYAGIVVAYALKQIKPPRFIPAQLATLPGATPARASRAGELLRLVLISRAVTGRVKNSLSGETHAPLRREIAHAAVSATIAASRVAARGNLPRAAVKAAVQAAADAHRGEIAVDIAKFVSGMTNFGLVTRDLLREFRAALDDGVLHPLLSAARDPARRDMEAARLASAFDSPVEVTRHPLPGRRPLPRAAVGEPDHSGSLYADDELVAVLTLARLAIERGSGALQPIQLAFSEALSSAPQLADAFSYIFHALTVIDLVCSDRFRHRTIADTMNALDGATVFAAARLTLDPDANSGSELADTYAADADLNCLVCSTDDGSVERVRVAGDVARGLRRECGDDPLADGAAAARALAAAYGARVDSGLARLRRWRFWPAFEAVAARLPPGGFPLRAAVFAGTEPAGSALRLTAHASDLSPACALIASALSIFAAQSAVRPGWPEPASAQRLAAVERVVDLLEPARAAAAATGAGAVAMASSQLAHALIAADCVARGAIANSAGDNRCRKAIADIDRALARLKNTSV